MRINSWLPLYPRGRPHGVPDRRGCSLTGHFPDGPPRNPEGLWLKPLASERSIDQDRSKRKGRGSKIPPNPLPRCSGPIDGFGPRAPPAQLETTPLDKSTRFETRLQAGYDQAARSDRRAS